jgi:hypothetical protein
LIFRRIDHIGLEAAEMRFLQCAAGYAVWDEEQELQNKVTTRNDEVGHTNTREEEKLAGTSTMDTIRKSSKATFILRVERKT